MNEEDRIGRIVYLLAVVGALLMSIGIGVALEHSPAYKQGQLDYQAGKIEWRIIDGKVHHIEAEGREE